jgi:hypothetical protein
MPVNKPYRQYPGWLVGVLLLGLAACAPASSPTAEAETIRSQTFTAAVDGAAAAEVRIAAPYQKVFISPAADPNQLIEAETEFIGTMQFSSEGTTRKTVRLAEDNLNQRYDGDRPLRWNVRLSTKPALNLNVDIRSGELALDGAGLNLERLDLIVGAGSLTADVPVTIRPLPIALNVGAGTATLNVPAGAQVALASVRVASGRLNLNFGSQSAARVEGIEVGAGTVSIDIPDDVALRLEVKSVAAGSINLMLPLVRITGTDPDEGIWETDGFAAAEHQISIVVESIGAGMLELQ